jgi:uncharacterized membrane protein YqjE
MKERQEKILLYVIFAIPIVAGLAMLMIAFLLVVAMSSVVILVVVADDVRYYLTEAARDLLNGIRKKKALVGSP